MEMNIRLKPKYSIKMDVLAGKLFCFFVKKGGKMDEEHNYRVYLHTNLINNKKYCGITCMFPLSKRWGHNGSKYKRNRHFWGAIQKYGWENFSHEILFEGLTKEEAEEKEKEIILKLNLTNQDYGYNMTPGGELSSEEVREKMRKSHKGIKLSEEHKKNISKGLGGKGVTNVNYGRKQTDIARLHNSLSKRGPKHQNWGKHLSDTTKERIREAVSKPVYQCDLEDNIIKWWENGKDAAKELGFGYKAINNCLREKRKTSNGFKWFYVKNYPFKDKEKDFLNSEKNNVNNNFKNKNKNKKESSTTSQKDVD